MHLGCATQTTGNCSDITYMSDELKFKNV